MIAIKDMEMPNCCLWDCPLAREDGGACQLSDVRTSDKERSTNCPLVEIVTCKDCKYYREDDDTGHCTNHTCGDIVFWCHADYYCADAERNKQ